MKGAYDDSLSWPLKDKLEVKLLNQISDSHHHSITLNDDFDTTFNNEFEFTLGIRVTEGDKGGGCIKSEFIFYEDLLYKITPAC